MIQIKRGLDVPITGEPEQQITSSSPVRRVALVGFDYEGMKPTMAVKEGDAVKKGQLLFSDKKTEGVLYTAPAGGVVSAINRGHKRVLQSVVIDVAESEVEESFQQYTANELKELSKEQVTSNLVQSGLWTAFKTRPYSKVPAPSSTANSIFVNAMDSNPLAANPESIIAAESESFQQGLTLISRLVETLFVCVAADSDVATDAVNASNIQKQDFSGPHPAGLSGTHIHYLDPVNANKTVWTIGYQDVIAVGKLFITGKLYTDRVIALAGPQVTAPRLLRTRLGADLVELTAGQLNGLDVGQENRVISGSVLSGRTATNTVAFLGRYHQQVTVLLEGKQREFMRYMIPGFNTHSALGIYWSSFSFLRALTGNKKMNYTTNTNGSERAMVPVGSYEKVMPLDILPTHLLRYLIVGDTDMAQQLGCLELDEEDLALCTYVCPGKYEYGPILRNNLAQIEQDG